MKFIIEFEVPGTLVPRTTYDIDAPSIEAARTEFKRLLAEYEWLMTWVTDPGSSRSHPFDFRTSMISGFETYEVGQYRRGTAKPRPRRRGLFG